MKIQIKRWYGPNYTIGKMSIDGIYFCDTLEDVNRDSNLNGKFDNGEIKVFGDTCIPKGIYNVIVSFSPKFKRDLPRLLNVPSFEGILIHAGNTTNDTHGCILVGENRVKGQVINSRKYENLIVEKCKDAIKRGEKITIEIL